jgi:hypothetical protein
VTLLSQLLHQMGRLTDARQRQRNFLIIFRHGYSCLRVINAG